MTYEQQLKLLAKLAADAAEQANLLKGFSIDGDNELSTLHHSEKHRRQLIKVKLTQALKALEDIENFEF